MRTQQAHAISLKPENQSTNKSIKQGPEKWKKMQKRRRSPLVLRRGQSEILFPGHLSLPWSPADQPRSCAHLRKYRNKNQLLADFVQYGEDERRICQLQRSGELFSIALRTRANIRTLGTNHCKKNEKSGKGEKDKHQLHLQLQLRGELFDIYLRP